VIDRDPLELGEFRADHLHRVLRDFDLVHLVEKKNHRAPVNLRVDDLNLVLMVAMKVFPNQVVQGDQKSQQNLVAMMVVQKMIHLMKDDRLMDDQNCLVDLNFRDALPYAYSLISIEI
jgi:hypothetical protein